MDAISSAIVSRREHLRPTAPVTSSSASTATSHRVGWQFHIVHKVSSSSCDVLTWLVLHTRGTADGTASTYCWKQFRFCWMAAKFICSAVCSTVCNLRKSSLETRLSVQLISACVRVAKLGSNCTVQVTVLPVDDIASFPPFRLAWCRLCVCVAGRRTTTASWWELLGAGCLGEIFDKAPHFCCRSDVDWRFSIYVNVEADCLWSGRNGTGFLFIFIFRGMPK